MHEKQKLSRRRPTKRIPPLWQVGEAFYKFETRWFFWQCPNRPWPRTLGKSFFFAFRLFVTQREKAAWEFLPACLKITILSSDCNPHPLNSINKLCGSTPALFFFFEDGEFMGKINPAFGKKFSVVLAPRPRLVILPLTLFCHQGPVSGSRTLVSVNSKKIKSGPRWENYEKA